MKKIIALILFVAISIFAAIGPVSQYGQLQAGTNNSGYGRLYGSCQGIIDGTEVQIRGMSLYWSLTETSIPFWSSSAITKMVTDMNIQLIRAAMATGTEDWSNTYNGQSLKGYTSSPDLQKNFVNTVVQSAIDNDIYVIIDWHSHTANEQTELAKTFFKEMAQKWGSYDNVIFELFNEPTTQDWSTIKSYAEQVISVIRQYSDNLIIVGNRSWDQYPNEALTNKINDNNVAYTFHYYACSHSTTSEGANALKAIKGGLTVFVSEWGTGNADGTGDNTNCSSANTTWQTWLNNNKLSWANWSASTVNEGTAAFNSGSNATYFNYTNSGTAVKNWLSTNPTSYTTCGSTITSSSSSIFNSSSSSVTTAIISNINNINTKQIKTIFDLNGNKVTSIQKAGIYIQRYTDGTFKIIRTK